MDIQLKEQKVVELMCINSLVNTDFEKKTIHMVKKFLNKLRKIRDIFWMIHSQGYKVLELVKLVVKAKS